MLKLLELACRVANRAFVIKLTDGRHQRRRHCLSAAEAASAAPTAVDGDNHGGSAPVDV